MRAVLFLALLHTVEAAPAELPTPEQVVASKLDLWAEAALRQPDGPTYDFFARLVPPLRYVDADFLHYPLVLSAPGATVKGRLVSNGSAINALARQPNFVTEAGTPVHVRVGPAGEPFGQDLDRLDGPHTADGWLPIYRLRYGVGGEHYHEEAFASVEEPLAASGTVVAKFSFPAQNKGRIALWFDHGAEVLTGRSGLVTDKAAKVYAAFDNNWEWNGARNALFSKPEHAASAYVTIFTRPADDASAASADFHKQQRDLCERRWRDLLAAGTHVEVPEPYVNNAWRSLIVGNYAIVSGDRMNYSAGNQYSRMYAHESGDALRGMTVWGHAKDLARTLRPLFVYKRPNIEYHDGAFKLRDLSEFYFLTRDKKLIEDLRPLWQKEIDLILKGRDAATGLLPREKYCSDIDTRISSKNANANAWRGLRDMSLVLEDVGETDEAKRLAAIAAEYRGQVLTAIERSTVRTVDPPFVPIAMDGEEPVPDPITGTRLGSYWNLVVQSLLSTGIFRYDSQPATDIMRYMQINGGLCMGMIRVQSARNFWVDPRNIDDLYGVRYALLLQQRDERDRALVSFYGKLAQGMTRETFYDGESSGIIPRDRFGRQMYLPPNSSANASFLQQLRCLLVQDWDMAGDGKIDTLRLLYATPRHWLRDGATIKVERAPTAFGEVSLMAQSELSKGRVTATVDLPSRGKPTKTLLRFRLPKGHEIKSATIDGQPAKLTGAETIDLTGRSGKVTVIAQAQPSKYPENWWKPVPKEGAPGWEILPQEAGPGEVILSKRNELGLLSNFAPTPFTFRGKRYASVEGFWQMMLYPEGPDDPRAKFPGLTWPHTRDEIAQMTAFKAKAAGTQAEENMKKMSIDWVTFEGKRFPYRPAEPGAHFRLIVAATREKVKQNPEVRRVLLSTGDLVLKPDHHTEPNAPAAWRYYDILTEIRTLLKAGEAGP
jgi:hypothetical protein